MLCRFFLMVILLIVSWKPVYSDSQIFTQAQDLIDSGQTSEGTHLYRDILRRYPGSAEAPEAQLKLAYLREKDDSEGAKEEFRKVFEEYPESGQALDALYHLGFMEFEAGEIESASDCYSALIARPTNKHTASSRIMRAKCSLKQRKPEAALPDLAKAAKEGVASGKHFEAQRLLAETWMENKDRLPALSGEVRAALPDALYLASDVYLNKREKPEEALPFLVELTDNYPEYSKRSGALFWRGAALIRTGRREEAARVYEEIVEKYPDRDHAIGAQQELVRLAHDAQNFEETQKRAEKLYAYPHTKAKLYAILSYWRACRSLGREDSRPMEMLDEFLANPNLEAKWADEARGIRDMILRTDKIIASATAEVDSAQPIEDGDPKMTGWRLGIQKAVLDEELDRGNVEAALELARRMLEEYPTGPKAESVRWHAAKIYARLNQFDKAYEILGDQAGEISSLVLGATPERGGDN